MAPKKILFLAAQPNDWQRLNLNYEAQKLQEALQKSLNPESYSILFVPAATPENLRDHLENQQPDIVHFCGHGVSEKGLVFVDEYGNPIYITGERLAGLLERIPQKPECVFLNACYSGEQASLIAKMVKCVIAMGDQKIADDAAIRFSTTFYQALGAGKTIESAFQAGQQAIEWLGLSKAVSPKIYSEDPYRRYLLDLQQELTEFLAIAVEEKLYVHAEDAPGEIAPISVEEPKHLAHYLLKEGASVVLEKGPDGHLARAFDDISDAYRYHQSRLLLLGEPGAGKSTAMMFLALDRISERLEDSSKPLPIFKRIADWQPEWNPVWEEEKRPVLADWLANGFADYGKKKDAEKLIRDGKVILILDALDELDKKRKVNHRQGFAHPEKPSGSDNPPPDGQRLITVYDPRGLFIECFNRQINPATPAIMSCRRDDYRETNEGLQKEKKAPLNLNGAVVLKTLTDQQIRAYLKNLPELWDVLCAQDELLDVARTPLLLRLFTVAFSGLSENLRQIKDLNQSALRNEIFSTYIERIYQRERDKQSEDMLAFSLEEIIDYLGSVAMEKLNSGGESGGTVSEDDFSTVMDSTRKQPFINLVTHLSLLHTEKQKTFRFIHVLMRNHLAYQRALKQSASLQPQEQRKAVDCLLQLADQSSADVLLDLLPGLVGKEEFAPARRRIMEILGELANPAALDVLQQELLDEDVDVQCAAAEALGKFPDEATLQALVGTLLVAADKPPLRRSIARSLGKLSLPGAVDPLLSLLEDNEDADRSWFCVGDVARDALIELGEGALPPLLGLLPRAEQVDFRLRVVEALIGLQQTETTYPYLLELLDDPEPSIRRAVIENFGEAATPGVSEKLLQKFSAEPNADVRGIMCRALGQMQPGEAAIVFLIQTIQEDAEEDVKKAAAQALIRVGEFAVPFIVDAFQKLDDSRTRTYLAFVLGAIGDQRAVTVITEALEHETGEEFVCVLVEALGQFDVPDSAIGLRKFLKAESEAVRVAAIEALGELKDIASADTFIDLLDDTPEIRGKAADALAALGEPVLELLSRRMKACQVAARRSIPGILEAIGGPKTIPLLVSLLSDDDEPVRLNTVTALGKLPAEDIPILRLSAISKDTRQPIALRNEAMQSLANSKTRGAVDLLVRAVHDESEEINLAAWNALETLEYLDDPRLDEPLRKGLSARSVDLRFKVAKILLEEKKDLQAAEAIIILLRDDAVKDDLQRGRYFDALYDWVKDNLPKEDSLVYFCRGLDHFIDGAKSDDLDEKTREFALALDDLSKAIENDPLKWYLYKWRAEVSLWAEIMDPDHLAQTVNDCKKVLGSRPDANDVYFDLGRAHYWLKEYPEALLAFEEYLSHLEGKTASAYYWRGRTHYEMGEYPLAIDDFSRTIDLAPDDANNYHWRGISCFQMGSYQRAKEDFTEAIRIKEDANNYNWRSDVHYFTGDYDLALADLNRAIELKSEGLAFYHWRGLVYIRLGRFADASDDFAKSAESLQDAVSLFWQALTKIALGQYDAAVKDLEQDLSIASEKGGDALTISYDHFWLGVIEACKGNLPSAYMKYGEAFGCVPTIQDKDNQNRVLAVIHLMFGKTDDARRCYQEILNANPHIHKFRTPPLYLALLAALFPERKEIAEIRQWFDGELKRRLAG